MNPTATNERVWKFTNQQCWMQRENRAAAKQLAAGNWQLAKAKDIPTLCRFPAARRDFCVWGGCSCGKTTHQPSMARVAQPLSAVVSGFLLVLSVPRASVVDFS